MQVRCMEKKDRDFVLRMDRHVDEAGYDKRVYCQSGYVLWEDAVPVGLMHYSVLWDKLPFLNLLIVDEAYRNRGFATQALAFWEDDMRRQGYKMVLLSTQADETAQNLYRRLGYKDCGGLVLENTPMDQPMELFFKKVL